jgi:putative flippase GtrA
MLPERARTMLPEMLPEHIAAILPEMLKFCIVGGLGTVIDLGGAALLHSKYQVEPLAAKAVSVTLATVLTYLGSRFWTFRERENQSVRREAVLFIVLNVVGLLIAEAVIGLVTYVMGLHSQLEYNAASFIGTGLGTIFRFWAYRKWVFLDPENASAPAHTPDAPAFPDYPPWELDPSFLVSAEAAAQAPVADQAPAPVATPSYSSPWERKPASNRQQAPAPSSWEAPDRQTAPFPESSTAPYPTAPTAPFPASPVAASPLPAPVHMPWPAPPAAPRSSGGRHRKS